jgi:hypothetical protein
VSYFDSNKGSLASRAAVRQESVAESAAAREKVKEAFDEGSTGDGQRPPTFRRFLMRLRRNGRRR